MGSLIIIIAIIIPADSVLPTRGVVPDSVGDLESNCQTSLVKLHVCTIQCSVAGFGNGSRRPPSRLPSFGHERGFLAAVRPPPPPHQ